MTKEEFDKRYPIKITQIVSEVSDTMKICLFNKDKKKLLIIFVILCSMMIAKS